MPNWKISIEEVPVEHQTWQWEESNYERYRQHISIALGNSEMQPHPFDVELTRVPPGARPCPVHAHSHRWELFIVLSGKAIVQRDGETVETTTGDCFMQPAGTHHRIRNGSKTEDLVFYVIANENEDDSTQRFEV